ncbi:MAG: hypothetical protein GOVbin2056_40 [Prokaryotic dsDNA virus sp.]|nr:MAG: hypothetical protein GOVbin2056_40 [Prokaryotic dsDNA virus sp.]|tara:strand:- start:10742 stop:11092 length:351 start_codon:yes stop_codon:yes gene_type:complete
MTRYESNQIKQMLRSHDKMVAWQCNFNACIHLLERKIDDLEFKPDGKIYGLKDIYKYVDKLREWNEKLNNERNHIWEKIALLDNPDATFLFEPTTSTFEWSDMPYKNWHKHKKPKV